MSTGKINMDSEASLSVNEKNVRFPDWKVIVAGGRDFQDRQRLYATLDDYIIKTEAAGYRPVIISGMARGADQLAVDYAEDHSIPLLPFRADWKKHGRAAGMIRNRQMADAADALIAFWDGRSRGTRNMIQTMMSLNKSYVIHHYGRK